MKHRITVRRRGHHARMIRELRDTRATVRRHALGLERMVDPGHDRHAPALDVPELEALLVAVADRLDVAADQAERARLGRGAAALEQELATLLER